MGSGARMFAKFVESGKWRFEGRRAAVEVPWPHCWASPSVDYCSYERHIIQIHSVKFCPFCIAVPIALERLSDAQQCSTSRRVIICLKPANASSIRPNHYVLSTVRYFNTEFLRALRCDSYDSSSARRTLTIRRFQDRHKLYDWMLVEAQAVRHRSG